GVTEEWSYDELINRSKEIVQEQKLLEVDFSFADAGAGKDDADDTLLQPWNLWVIITLLTTFMLFDWVIKEKKARSEEHTSELQSRFDLVCRFLLEEKNH